MAKPPKRPAESSPVPERRSTLKGFRSETVEQVRARGGVWKLPGGEILLPRSFGFCRGVERALKKLEEAVEAHDPRRGKLFLLGEIIHNPWANGYFQRRGVRILSGDEISELEKFITPRDCAVVPAFGVPLPIERRLRRIGCRILDTSCGDVRKVWSWAERAVEKGYGILIFGLPPHDETVVTKSRLAAVGGRYVVVSNLAQTARFCSMIGGAEPADTFKGCFDEATTNAETLEPFQRLAQVSQTTMLYDETMQVRGLLRAAYSQRYGPDEAEQRLLFEPTVCRATQDRQSAAIELCQTPCDLVIVVGGFVSSNTRHLFELARAHGPAFFIEDAPAIRSPQELHSFDLDRDEPVVIRDWLPGRRPLRVGVLAGASSPEIVIGEVLRKLAEFLS